MQTIYIILGILISAVIIYLIFWYIQPSPPANIVLPTKYSFNEYTNTCFINDLGTYFSIDSCEAANLPGARKSGQAQTCDSDADCITNFYCSKCNYKCRQKQPVGAFCDDSIPCLDGIAYCDTTHNICMPLDASAPTKHSAIFTMQLRISPLSAFVSINSRPIVESTASYIYIIGYDADENLLVNDQLLNEEVNQAYFDHFLQYLPKLAFLMVFAYKIKPSDINPNFLEFIRYLGGNVKVYRDQSINFNYMYVGNPQTHTIFYEDIANSMQLERVYGGNQ